MLLGQGRRVRCRQVTEPCGAGAGCTERGPTGGGWLSRDPPPLRVASPAPPCGGVPGPLRFSHKSGPNSWERAILHRALLTENENQTGPEINHGAQRLHKGRLCVNRAGRGGQLPAARIRSGYGPSPRAAGLLGRRAALQPQPGLRPAGRYQGCPPPSCTFAPLAPVRSCSSVPAASRRVRRPREGPAAACSLRRAWVPRAVRVAGSSTNEWVSAGKLLVPAGRSPVAPFSARPTLPSARRPRPAIGPSGIAERDGAKRARPCPGAAAALGTAAAAPADGRAGEHRWWPSSSDGRHHRGHRPLRLFSPPGSSAAVELPGSAALCRARPLAALPPGPAPSPSRARSPEAGGSGPGRWRMCNTDKQIIVTNYFRGPGSDAVPSFSAHRRHGAVGPRSGLLTAAALPRPPSGPQEGVSHRERREETESSYLYSEGFEAAW
ncbi:translation initiation factor IF-2-like [Pyrgilauda ruficollis]|uniref:translation initiation factor IF-2-like n=1 Tax=Pyrgilauda ruficollis TaxID=221976 RepID=UPI001B865521|nr:translation initiation factor IF-2-like [Pyrgilauda ruficollis]